MFKTARKFHTEGFTLVELLVVIAIIAILAAIVVLIINPLELTRRGRDAARLTDLASLQNAINVAVQESTASGQNVLCGGSSPGGTGQACTGTSYPASATNRESDGDGWVRVNLSAQKSVSVPTLPIDPTNNATLNYDYGTNTPAAGEYPDRWEINAVLESDQYKGKMENDGGNNTGAYEVGSDLVIIN